MADGVTESRFTTSLVVFGVVMSFMCTFMLCMLLPSNASEIYDAQEIENAQYDLMSFTGQNLVNDTPWVMTGAYLPYTGNGSYSYTNSGWINGPAVNDAAISGQYYSAIHQVPANGYQLSTNGKSLSKLGDADTSNTETVEISRGEGIGNMVMNGLGWIVNNTAGNINNWLFGGNKNLMESERPTETYTHEVAYKTWNYSGYRYVFQPMMSVGSSSQNITTEDGSLSVVWYKQDRTDGVQTGLSGGLVFTDGTFELANINAKSIVSKYNVNSDNASTYKFQFNGFPIYVAIHFDLNKYNGFNLEELWDNGWWTMMVYTSSVNNLQNISGSISYTTNAAEMVNTFVKLMTLQNPFEGINGGLLSNYAVYIFWVICVVPMLVALMYVIMRILDIIVPL